MYTNIFEYEYIMGLDTLNRAGGSGLEQWGESICKTDRNRACPAPFDEMPDHVILNQNRTGTERSFIMINRTSGAGWGRAINGTRDAA